MTDMEVESPDTQDPEGLAERISDDHGRGPSEVRILGLLVGHADEFLGMREDPEDPAGFIYSWASVVLTEHGKRLMNHLPESIGSLIINYETGRWQVQEAGEIVAEGFVPFT